MENVVENKLTLGNMATPLTVADAVIRENPEKEWREDVVFFINAYIKRTYNTMVKEDDSEGDEWDKAKKKFFEEMRGEE